MTNWLTLNELKDILGIETGYTGEDARIKVINSTTTITLEKLLGRTLVKQTHVEYIDSKNNGARFYDVFGESESGIGFKYKEIKYYLKNYPIDPDSVELFYQPNNVIDGAVPLDTSEYILDAEKGILTITIPTGTYSRAIKITYDAGYEPATANAETTISASIPADLKQAAIYQAIHAYDKIKMSNINVRESRSQGSTNSTRFVNIHAIAPEAMAIIVQNKRRNFSIV